MSTKLTLTIEQSIIEKAKKYAQKRKRSLSDLIENYLKTLTSEEDFKKEDETTPTVKALRGSFKEPKDFDYKEELTKQLIKKHL
jgi:hypothetical protein